MALNGGARPLVHVDTHDKMEIVVQEILQDKIYLDAASEVRVTGDHPSSGGSIDFDFDSI